MEFNSYIFILAYLPILICGYYALGKYKGAKFQNIYLIGASLVFIGYGSVFTLILILMSAVCNYFLAKWIVNECDKSSKLKVGLGIGLNLAVLGYFKYSSFFLDNLNSIFKTDWTLVHVFIPLGISFVTFQQIIFLVEVSRRNILELSFEDYLFYISYFPKFIQGPIAPYQELVNQFRDKDKKIVNADNLAYGLYLFAIGLAKKVLLADVLAKAVSYGWQNLYELSALEGILTTLFFTLQIYFDFSGYSHMAIGVSKMLNISILDNFDRPYLARSITDFWAKWHISLTNFLREYVYFPLGGNRKGKARTYINIMIVYIISGLWHGASWNYVFWGLVHGIGNCFDRVVAQVWKRVTRWIQIPVTFIFVNFAWIFFRAPSIQDALEMLKRLGIKNGWELTNGFAVVFHTSEVLFLQERFQFIDTSLTQNPACVLGVFVVISFLVVVIGKDRVEPKFEPSVIKCVLTIAFLWWSILSLSNVVEFIYANF